MQIIGLTGPARAGKDTVAGFIEELTPDRFSVHRQGFADLLKISAARALGLEGDGVAVCNGLKEPGSTISVTYTLGTRTYTVSLSGREFLQRYGTEAHRDVFSDNFWVEQLFDSVGPEDCNVLVIPDVRFPNEAKAILDRGGSVVRVTRQVEGIVEAAHASEAGLPDELVTYDIFNGGSLEELREKVAVSLRPRIVLQNTDGFVPEGTAAAEALRVEPPIVAYPPDGVLPCGWKIGSVHYFERPGHPPDSNKGEWRIVDYRVPVRGENYIYLSDESDCSSPEVITANHHSETRPRLDKRPIVERVE